MTGSFGFFRYIRAYTYTYIHTSISINLFQAHDQPQMSQECMSKFTQATSPSQFKYIVLKHPWFLNPEQCYVVIQSYCFRYPKASKPLKHSAVILVLLSIFFHACQENVIENHIHILAHAKSWLFGWLCYLRHPAQILHLDPSPWKLLSRMGRREGAEGKNWWRQWVWGGMCVRSGTRAGHPQWHWHALPNSV